MAELKTCYGHANARSQKEELHGNNSKHLSSTVVSSLDMLKQSYSGVKTIQQCEYHMNA